MCRILTVSENMGQVEQGARDGAKKLAHLRIYWIYDIIQKIEYYL